MSPLIGPWRLRFLVIDRETPVLLYLTSHGIDKQVTIESQESDNQKWFALPVDGKRDWYIITPEPAAISPPGLARTGDNVILSETPDEWRLQYVPIDIANGDVYEIHSRELIGVESLLGEKENNAVIQTFVVGYDGPKPAWQFLASE